MTNKTEKPLVEAALGRSPARYPVWFLRQAGRYLPEYREIRAQMSFLELCADAKKAAEVTLQPLKRFDVDAAIIFADILLIPMAMGQGLSFGKGHGPVLVPEVRSQKDVDALDRSRVADQLSYVGEAIIETKKGLSTSQTMIGFAGAPFTVASYMIEGRGSKNYTELKTLIFQNPTVFGCLMNELVEASFEYLKMQVEAGAETIMLFDSWAGNLAPDDYRQHVFGPTNELISRVKELGVPVIYFPGQGGGNLGELGDCKADVIHIDWRLHLDKSYGVLESLGLDVSIQGNLDPQVLLADKELVQERVKKIVSEAEASGCRQHIFNVGHGLLPHTNPESLSWVIDALR